ncbi:MAG: SUMF1/EgtB/PvdO family nonheme iron enzyme [Phycisphaerales bacterium]|nr:SUMF1/EgtB/PvdO family nonheme iron enzyme [Phycisphaerales bacterium]
MPQASLGVFGKHPGWNDHIDDLGLDTQRLTDLKRVLYVDGIAACVESGQWEKLEETSPGATLPEFDHTLLWRAAGSDAAPSTDFLIARLWSSRDGKGRDKYPMVVAVHAQNMGLPDALQLALPTLDALASRCRQAVDPAEVVAYVDVERRRIAEEAARIGSLPSPPPPSLTRFLEHPDLGPERQGIRRVMFQFERELGPFLRAGRADSQDRGRLAASRQLRLPACGSADAQVLAQWARFIDTRIDPAHPLMLIHPRGRAWVDAIFGEPTGSQMFCLRAAQAAIPLVSQVPYTLDADFIRAADLAIDSALTSPDSAGGPPAPVVAPIAPRSAARTLAIVVILLALLAVAVYILVAAAPLPDRAGGAEPPTGAVGEAKPIESAAIAAALHRQALMIRQRIALVPAQAETLGAQFQRTEAFLRGLDRSLPRGIRRPDPQPAWMERLNAELANARERRLERVLAPWSEAPVDPALAGSTDDVEREASEFVDLCGRAARAADQMAAVESLLDNAWGSAERRTSSDATAAAQTIQELSGEWAGRAKSDPVIRRIVGPLLERVEGLRAAEGVNDALILVSGAHTPDPSRPELALASWRRLSQRPGVLWPATVEELDQEAAAAASVRGVIDRLPDPARRGQLREHLAQEESRRLIRFLSYTRDAANIDAGFSRLAEFGVSPDQLDPWLRYNFHLRGLRASVDRLGEAELRAEIRRFATAARELPGGVSFRSEVVPVLTDLELIAGGKEPASLPAWYAALGPAATGRYTASAERDGDRLVFSPKAEFSDWGHALPIEFVLVRPPAGSGVAPFYIGTSEVGVAAFASMHAVSAADSSVSTPRLARFLQTFAPDEDPRFGPRSWEWNPDRTSIRPAHEWLISQGGRIDEYGIGQFPLRPVDASPVQHIAPVAAACFASLVGCRLPTSGEWLAAAGAFAAVPQPSNFRDQTWARHRDHIAGLTASGLAVQPADAGALDRERLDSSGQKSIVPVDDGWLWFAPDPQSPVDAPRHMIGNVAEYVLDASVAFPADPRGARTVELAGSCSERFKVIGGSALTDPAMAPQTPRTVNLAEAAEGYCDVGFRLVFTGKHVGADAHSMAARLDRLLTPTPYLKAK